MATEKKTGSIVPARKETLMIGGIPQDAVFFQHPGEPGGWMSNWFLSPFTLDGTDFSSMEQYIMVRKCMLFGDEALAAAVLRTDEPGLYIDEEGIGIRIEDDLLITEDGCEVLSREIPKDPDEIEAVMAAR